MTTMGCVKRITCLLICFVPFLQPTNAVKCFTCNSKQDPRCKDPFKGPYPGLDVVDCSQDQQTKQNTRQAIEEVLTLMTKLGQVPLPVSSEQPMAQIPNDTIPMACQKMEIEVLGEQVTGRGCSAKPMGYFRPCDTIKLITSSDIKLLHCSLCDEDSCNGSWQKTATSWIMLLGFLLVVL